jgi:nucleoside-diphosphate-sugar epimerase
MKVFVAGASGVIGRPLVRQLVEAGHEVTGMTRSEGKAEPIREAGGTAVVCDVFDAPALEAAVTAAEPEVVINQLTNLPHKNEPRKASFFETTNRVRSEGGRNLLAAARAVGARRASSPRASAFSMPPKATGSRTRTRARSTTLPATFAARSR